MRRISTEAEEKAFAQVGLRREVVEHLLIVMMVYHSLDIVALEKQMWRCFKFDGFEALRRIELLESEIRATLCQTSRRNRAVAA